MPSISTLAPTVLLCSCALFASALARPLQARTSTTSSNSSLLNVAYFGQGPDQPALSTFCNDSTLDIIPIAFVNGVSSDSTGGYPAMNFGNACDSYYSNGSVETSAFTDCTTLEADIATCQDAGTKIFISIGGADADVTLSSEDDAVAFADQLWEIFGPYDSSYSGPRPFGTASVDGFDFDIESGDGSYWVNVASTLRSKIDSDSGDYYLSATPQCLTSDIMAPMIKSVSFDYVWVQYFNTPACSARNFFDEGDSRSGIGYDTWAAVLEDSANPSVPLFIGLPGSAAAVPSYPDNYLSVAEASVLIETFGCDDSNTTFGGIMLWDATYALDNDDYAASIREALNSPCDLVSATSTATASTASSTAASSTRATATTTSSGFITSTVSNSFSYSTSSSEAYTTPEAISSPSYSTSSEAYTTPEAISSLSYSHSSEAYTTPEAVSSPTYTTLVVSTSTAASQGFPASAAVDTSSLYGAPSATPIPSDTTSSATLSVHWGPRSRWGPAAAAAGSHSGPWDSNFGPSE